MKRLFALLASAVLPVCAFAQSALYSYSGESFTLRLMAQDDIRIVSTSDYVFAADDDDEGRKADIDVCKGISVSGYSLVRKEIDDADFFVSDNGKEMMVESPREARRFIKYLSVGRTTGVSLKIDVEDVTAPKGVKSVYFELPSNVVSELIKANR